jgi:hypothetical protein
MRVLSFDPGDTTGWVYQTPEKMIDFGQVQGLKNLIAVCREYEGEVDYLVIEDYVILGSKAMSHTGSRVPAIQIIGWLKGWALEHDIPIKMYPARMKPIQQKRTQKFPKGAHSKNHWVDAYNHGRYFLIEQGLAKSALQIEKEKARARTDK